MSKKTSKKASAIDAANAKQRERARVIEETNRSIALLYVALNGAKSEATAILNHRRFGDPLFYPSNDIVTPYKRARVLEADVLRAGKILTETIFLVENVVRNQDVALVSGQRITGVYLYSAIEAGVPVEFLDMMKLIEEAHELSCALSYPYTKRNEKRENLRHIVSLLDIALLAVNRLLPPTRAGYSFPVRHVNDRPQDRLV